MKPNDPAPGHTPHRLVLVLLTLVFLALGSGCVSWDPLFRVAAFLKAAAAG